MIDPAQLKQLQHVLGKIIDPGVDSLRFYYLGDKWRHRVEHLGPNQASIWKGRPLPEHLLRTQFDGGE